MRQAFALSELFSVAIVLIAGPACAQNYNLPWCATLDNDGTTQCAYYTQQQCLETLSGIGGQCTPNPSPPAPILAPAAPLPSADPGPPLDLEAPPGLNQAGNPRIPPARQQGVAAPNNLFTAAGFVVKYATTPEKRAILRSLPPDRLVKRTKDGILYYVYADAARCNCAYVGTAQANAAYQNAPNDPDFIGGDQNAIHMIDSDVESPYIPDNNVYSGVDSVLGSGF